MDRLLSKGVKCVIITSVEFIGREDELVLFAGNNEGYIILIHYVSMSHSFC